ncbi:F-box/kelch-repeat protein SKIP4, partial [Glycine soja]
VSLRDGGTSFSVKSGLCRNKSNEIFYYVLDPTSSMRYWKLVDDLPPHILKREGMGFEALGNKLFLLGGCSEFLDSTDEVYSYDASSNCCAQATSLSTARYPVTPHVFAVVYEPSSGTWEYADEDIVSGWTGPAVAVDAASLSNARYISLSIILLESQVKSTVLFYFYKTFRCYLTCEVLDEKLYAIGGLVSNSSNHSWNTFDPLTNCWTFHIDPNIGSDIKDSVVLDGKIYVRCARHPDVTRRVFVVVHEPSSGTWQYADADMVSGWTGPAVVVDGTLYVLDKSLGTSLMMWHKDQVGKLSPWLTRPSFRCMVIWGMKVR